MLLKQCDILSCFEVIGMLFPFEPGVKSPHRVALTVTELSHFINKGKSLKLPRHQFIY